jgi:ParB/RepB/Spo0J family partition protein
MSLEVINLNQIRENPVALRTVHRQAEDYLGLVESIKEKGFLGAITARKKIDEESGEEYFELVDGLHRFSAAKDAGLEKINVDVTNLDDDKVLEAQIMANIHKIETRPIQYTEQLKRIFARNPLLTEAELAGKLGKSTQWIKERLNLTKITNPTILSLIDEGKIGLANAYALAKLPTEEQADFVDRAMTDAPDEFVPAVHARVKEIREAKRKGKDAEPKEFTPSAFLQKLGDIKAELEAGAVADVLIKQTGTTAAKDAFLLAIKWVLHLDPVSVEDQKAKNEARKQEREDAKKRKAAEKAKKQAEKAAEKAEEAKKLAAKMAEDSGITE